MKTLVAAREPLFDFKLPLCERRKHVREKLWKEIKSILKTKLSIAELSKKWKTLRYYYMKVKGDIEARIPSGSSATQKFDQKSKIWKHYYAMKFLDDSFE